MVLEPSPARLRAILPESAIRGKRHTVAHRVSYPHGKVADLAAIETAFLRYWRIMTRRAFRFVRNEADAEDCVQRAFLKAVQFRHQHVEGNVEPWIFAILDNQCWYLLRRNARMPEVGLWESLPAPSTGASVIRGVMCLAVPGALPYRASSAE